MKSIFATLLLSLAMVLPFAVLELVSRRDLQEEFPFVLFTFMSVHALLIILLLKPALRLLQAERNMRALRLTHWAGLLSGTFLLYLYITVVVDQFPCFLGMPNCD